MTVTAADGTENTLTDTEYNNDNEHPENENAENAVIKCKDGSDVTLCGSGNASGCHGMAHSGRLHFRCLDGRLQFLLCRRPMRYEDALLVEDGWQDAGWFE